MLGKRPYKHHQICRSSVSREAGSVEITGLPAT